MTLTQTNGATATVQGDIGKIVAWKTGRGYFLNLKGQEADYYAFGAPKHKEGESVELTVKEGTGSFSDKLLITQIKPLQPTTAQVQEKVQAAAQKMQDYCESADKVYYDRQDLIVQQTCIKAAAELVGKLWPRQEKPNMEEIANTVLYFKDRFYFDITGQEESNEEPKEVK